MNNTPNSNRIHISFFGRRNAGKSSLINAVTGQPLSIVSDVPGTTTDPVSKAMELLPLGPVLITDTPGLDDDSVLGEQRIEKAIQVLNKTDICVLVVDSQRGITTAEQNLIKIFKEKELPFIIVYNKSDLKAQSGGEIFEVENDKLKGRKDENKKLKGEKLEESQNGKNIIFVSAKTGEGVSELKELLGKQVVSREKFPILSDLITAGDIVILVIPIDAAAPKGRIILPQQQALREILDVGATAVVCRETELEQTLLLQSKAPKIVITDSQVFKYVAEIVPKDIPLTGFSVLFARHKGDLRRLYENVKKLGGLKTGDRIFIAEGCTHHRQCDDIGTVKIPRWIKSFTGIEELIFEFSSGTGFPADLTQYKMIVHCGGCMLNDREMKNRIAAAEAQGVAVVNYGIVIAYMNGILERALEPFEGKF